MAEAEDAGMPPLPPANVPYIQCRILNYEPIISLKNLKANYYGQYGKLDRLEICGRKMMKG